MWCQPYWKSHTKLETMMASRRHLAIIVVVTVVIQVAICQIQRFPSKQCRAFCFQDDNQLNMLFTCDMNSDPEGAWYGLDFQGRASDCFYSMDNNILNITTVVARNPSVNDVNSCGRLVRSQGGVNSYEWQLLYVEFPVLGIWAGLDRIYSFTCNSSTITNTKVSASVDISIDLTRVVLPTTPTVTLNALVKDVAGNYVPILNNEPVRVGSDIQLELLQILDNSDNLTPYCASGFSCIVSGNSIFGDTDDVDILDGSGCPTRYSVDNLRISIAPETGFIQISNTATTCRSRTGAIRVYQIGRSLTQYYQCRVHFCFPGDGSCNDLCAARTTTRRKRQAPEGEKIVELKITLDLEENDTDTGLSEKTVIGLSVGIGVTVILLLVLAISLYYFCRQSSRRSMTDENIKYAYKNGIPPKE